MALKSQSLRQGSQINTSNRLLRPPTVRQGVAVAAVQKSSSCCAGAVVQELLQLVEGTERGLNTPADKQQDILQLVDELKAAQAGAVTTSDQVLSATWEVSLTPGDCV